jgi:uncharacterized protein
VSSRLTLRVTPGASRAAVVGRYGEAWKVRVTAAPENGKANAAVVDLLAETLGIPERDVEIVAGQASRDKTVSFTGIDADEAERRLDLASGPGKDAG